MSRKPSPRAARRAGTSPRFSPAKVRARADGWTPERQLAFIDALAASGCVAEACAAVGMGRSAAYALRVRPEAQQFRMAWDAALDLAIRRLSDACFSRALHGEAIPHYYQGEVVGEHRRYDNRLAMFLLRYRDPLRYAATLDQMVYKGHPENAGVGFARARNAVQAEAEGFTVDTEDAPAPFAHETEPVATARVREEEAAIVAGSAPIYGSWERRSRLQKLRTERHAAQKAQAEAAMAYEADDEFEEDDFEDELDGEARGGG